MAIEFEIPGEPKAKARPRFGNGQIFTDQPTVNYENWVKLCYRNDKGSLPHMDGPLWVMIDAYFAIPKSASKIKKILIIVLTAAVL